MRRVYSESQVGDVYIFQCVWEMIMIVNVINSVSDDVFVLMVLLLASVVFLDPIKLKAK